MFLGKSRAYECSWFAAPVIVLTVSLSELLCDMKSGDATYFAQLITNLSFAHSFSALRFVVCSEAPVRAACECANRDDGQDGKMPNCHSRVICLQSLQVRHPFKANGF